MARRNDLEMFLRGLARLPWWVSVVVAAVVYLAMSEVLPRVAGDSTALGPLVDALSKIAGPAAALFLIPGAVSAFRGIRGRRTLAAARRIDEMTWQEFEESVGAHYEGKGYVVVREGGDGPDGKVDLRLRRRGEIRLVQCKHWPKRRVGVKVVRELLGVVSAAQATGGILVTSGSSQPRRSGSARTIGSNWWTVRGYRR